jgi:hypothetical protein
MVRMITSGRETGDYRHLQLLSSYWICDAIQDQLKGNDRFVGKNLCHCMRLVRRADAIGATNMLNGKQPRPLAACLPDGSMYEIDSQILINKLMWESHYVANHP